MHVFSIILGALALGSCADAHMALLYPPPFRSKFNPNVASGNIDYNMVAPLQASGSDFPCKGYQIDLGTAAGASVATWNAGSAYNFTVSGGATQYVLLYLPLVLCCFRRQAPLFKTNTDLLIVEEVPVKRHLVTTKGLLLQSFNLTREVVRFPTARHSTSPFQQTLQTETQYFPGLGSIKSETARST